MTKAAAERVFLLPPFCYLRLFKPPFHRFAEVVCYDLNKYNFDDDTSIYLSVKQSKNAQKLLKKKCTKNRES